MSASSSQFLAPNLSSATSQTLQDALASVCQLARNGAYLQAARVVDSSRRLVDSHASQDDEMFGASSTAAASSVSSVVFAAAQEGYQDGEISSGSMSSRGARSGAVVSAGKQKQVLREWIVAVQQAVELHSEINHKDFRPSIASSRVLQLLHRKSVALMDSLEALLARWCDLESPVFVCGLFWVEPHTHLLD